MLHTMQWLIADIGGTHTRCARLHPDGGVEGLRLYDNRDHAGPVAILSDMLASLPAAARPTHAVLAVAAPIDGDTVHMVNIDWTFSAIELARQLGLRQVFLLNDFAALAHALPDLGPADLMAVGGGTPLAGAPKVVVGPGTGLGAAALVDIGGRWHAIAGESGHRTMGAADEREERLIALARQRWGHCSAERLISGNGLSFLHEALHAETLAAEAIGRRITQHEPRAVDTFAVFCRLLGTFAGDLALTFNARGGVYLGGGILPRHAQALAASGFRQRFEDKGRYATWLAGLPCWLITADQPTLRGLAAWTAGAGRT